MVRVERGGSSPQPERSEGKTGKLGGRKVTADFPSTIKGPPSSQTAYKSGKINAKPLSQSSGLSGIIQRIIQFIKGLFGTTQKTAPDPHAELKREILNLKETLKDTPGETLKEKMVHLERKGELSTALQAKKNELTASCTKIVEDSMKGKAMYNLNSILNSLDPEILAFVDRDNMKD